MTDWLKFHFPENCLAFKNVVIELSEKSVTTPKKGLFYVPCGSKKKTGFGPGISQFKALTR